ncbi:MAG: midcut-by-XrtH protein, partial [Cellvibrionaceae bacterium]|nr:midcut-by-XrtH protein [Cellvibrionaceae bacterium]
MKSFAVRCFAAVLVSVNPSTALAQITTIYSPEPIPTTSASISVLLTAAVLLLGLRKIWQRRVKASAQLLAIGFGLFAINLWQSPELRAQLRLAFSNPYGETLQIPIDRIVNEQTLVGFQYADFINSSGRPLMIRTIAAPTFEHCFPGGLSAPFLPPALPPAAEQSPYPECEEELRLRPDKICRYSVERACDLAEQQHQALLELSPAEITLEAFGTVGELTLRNNPNAQASARNLSIAPPGALVVSDDCGAELRPGDSCTISLQANGAGGPDPLEIHSDNSYDVSSLVSANAWDPEVPVSQRQTLALQRLLDDQQSCNPFTALPFAPDILGLLDINTMTALPSTSASYAEKGFEVRRCGNFTLLVQQELGQPVRSLLLIEGDIQPSYGGLFAQFDQSTLTDTIIYQVAPGFDSNALSPAELPDVLAAAVTRSYGGSLGLKAGQHITGRVTLRGFAAQVLSAMN